ncbi:MAG TPA: hypothetical protein VK669_07865 [Candidatus Limnocylindrales bacterium]|nr:hypothetical protein [Candidatus Limnocylindrales bacterium]
MSPWKDVGPDFAVETPYGVILVEVKRRLSNADRSSILEKLRQNAADHGQQIAVTLLADNEHIWVYRDPRMDATPVAELPTAAILSEYDPDFSREVVYEDYLLSLMQAWLNHFSLSTLAKQPPGKSALPEDVVAALAA